ncbi:hypothetical protein BJY04DRAFT_180384 [Aspergillus karnatakaensis]|uniref:uncharacterized protein n=1 Tax=Aspergillus karnatakaensis TaxID=1810916 RepID=UPI003CCDB181
MPVYSLIIINKAGGLIYQREFQPGLRKLSTNDYLVLAGTFHGSVLPLLLLPAYTVSVGYEHEPVMLRFAISPTTQHNTTQHTKPIELNGTKLTRTTHTKQRPRNNPHPNPQDPQPARHLNHNNNNSNPLHPAAATATPFRTPLHLSININPHPANPLLHTNSPLNTPIHIPEPLDPADRPADARNGEIPPYVLPDTHGDQVFAVHGSADAECGWCYEEYI